MIKNKDVKMKIKEYLKLLKDIKVKKT